MYPRASLQLKHNPNSLLSSLHVKHFSSGQTIGTVDGFSVIIVVGASVIVVVVGASVIIVVGASVFVVGIFVVIALVDGADVDSFVVKAVVGGMTQFPSSNE